MKQPVKNLKIAYAPTGDITQYFGENPVLYSRFGLKGHNGVDIVRPHGELMYAMEDCWVVDVKEDPQGYGKYIRIVSKAKDKDGFHREWTYGHNSQNLVQLNDEVKEGQGIALMGNTGFVVSGATPYWKTNPFAGTHLHLGLRLVELVNKGGWVYKGTKIRVKTQNYDNGYKGSINPIEYLLKADKVETNSALRETQMTLIGVLNKFIKLLNK